jgi:hypothetical protein
MSVLLLHGLGRGSVSMMALARAARRSGHAVVNPWYPSLFEGPEELLERHVRPALLRARSQGAPVHVITHSLGGILIRMAVGREVPPWLGRVVMICPPNRGSEIIDFARRSAVGRLVVGPTGQCLGTSADALPRSLPPIPFQCGVIGADRCPNPLLGALLPKPNDGKVGVYSMTCEGVADFALVHTTHTLSTFNPEVIRLAFRFIEQGRFA